MNSMIAVAFSIVLAVCTEGRGEHARPVPEYYCTGFLLAFGSVLLVMAILYIIVPSRMYMRGENFWPDLDSNLLKRIMGVFMLFVGAMIVSAAFGH
jgi:type IV secretory pathway VirB2 component (pilin)